MKEKSELKKSQQINRLNEALKQRNNEKDSLQARIVELEGKEVEYEQTIRELERDCESKLKMANVRNWKIVKRI